MGVCTTLTPKAKYTLYIWQLRGTCTSYYGTGSEVCAALEIFAQPWSRVAQAIGGLGQFGLHKASIGGVRVCALQTLRKPKVYAASEEVCAEQRYQYSLLLIPED